MSNQLSPLVEEQIVALLLGTPGSAGAQSRSSFGVLAEGRTSSLTTVCGLPLSTGIEKCASFGRRKVHHFSCSFINLDQPEARSDALAGTTPVPRSRRR